MIKIENMKAKGAQYLATDRSIGSRGKVDTRILDGDLFSVVFSVYTSMSELP